MGAQEAAKRSSDRTLPWAAAGVQPYGLLHLSATLEVAQSAFTSQATRLHCGILATEQSWWSPEGRAFVGDTLAHHSLPLWWRGGGAETAASAHTSFLP